MTYLFSAYLVVWLGLALYLLLLSRRAESLRRELAELARERSTNPNDRR